MSQGAREGSPRESMSGASVFPAGTSLDRGGEVPSSSRTSLEEAWPEGGEGRNNMIKSLSRDPEAPPSVSQCAIGTPTHIMPHGTFRTQAAMLCLFLD